MCANCGEEGHDKLKCPKPRREPGQRPCFRCLKTGHVARDCKAGDPAKSLEAEDARTGDEVTFFITGEEFDEVNVAESEGPRYFSERHFEVVSDDDEEEDHPEDGDDDEELPSTSEDVASEGETSQNVGPCCRHRCTERGLTCPNQLFADMRSELDARAKSTIDADEGLTHMEDPEGASQQWGILKHALVPDYEDEWERRRREFHRQLAMIGQADSRGSPGSGGASPLMSLPWRNSSSPDTDSGSSGPPCRCYDAKARDPNCPHCVGIGDSATDSDPDGEVIEYEIINDELEFEVIEDDVGEEQRLPRTPSSCSPCSASPCCS